ncbi:MAG: 23S rRNA (pseudouridine(1915)-N(3))-methyltransferase RlmH [Deltaproteobacteria bacterium]|nr:23S rRNA (pseudouridine(1915)-N(3))-methyltransferase RlmH [Deltaproteobacteria bacterium]
MKICLATIGQFKSQEYERLAANYVKLAGKFAGVEAELLHLPVPKGVPEHETQNEALTRLLEKRGARAFLTLLDERGKSFTSREFAKRVEKIKDGSHSEWIIAVGGAHGYDDTLKTRAQLLWSLSPLTFPHELAAAVAAEQVFRALSILSNHPYHND